MSNVIMREDILKQRMDNVTEGELVLELFKVAEELAFGDEIDLENKFSLAALEYVHKPMQENTIIKLEKVYTCMRNVYYVVELYLRGFYGKEVQLKHEEFLNLVVAGKSMEVIEASHKAFNLHINRLKKLIAKAKKRIPWNNPYFKNTKKLLEELDKDLSICERYPTTSANLSEFYFGRYYGIYGPSIVTKLTGFLAMEKTIYSLYNELCILSKFEEKNINNICDTYVRNVGSFIPFNPFDKIVNNYLFAQPYSDNPEDLTISKVDAELLIREIKLGTLNATELVDQLIDKYEFKGYRSKYLKEYGEYIQKKIKAVNQNEYFGELFLVS